MKEEERSEFDTRDQKAAAGSGPGEIPDVSVGRFAVQGFQFAAAIFVGVFGGRWLDTRFGTTPFLMMAGVFVCAGASLFGMYRALTRVPKR